VAPIPSVSVSVFTKVLAQFASRCAAQPRPSAQSSTIRTSSPIDRVLPAPSAAFAAPSPTSRDTVHRIGLCYQRRFFSLYRTSHIFGGLIRAYEPPLCGMNFIPSRRLGASSTIFDLFSSNRHHKNPTDTCQAHRAR
jgi:hypothetical protein